MDNILILGVEGSGKTVLAMALAKVFADHADAGLRLKPENRAAFRFLEQMPASLYAVPLPPEQPGRYADLRFTVCRGQQDLFALNVPECPPELFRLAFQKAAEQADPAAFAARTEALRGDLDTLRERVMAASRVFVLFDVSSIRDGEGQQTGLDAVWATNACIRHLLSLPYPPAIALVLTHADRDPASGNDYPAILRKRLPLIADNYPSLPGFAVSAVKPDDPEVGLHPLLFSMFGKTGPLEGLLDEARGIWRTLAAPDKDAAPPTADALNAAADRLDALRSQAPWFAREAHATYLAPAVSETLRRLAGDSTGSPEAAGGPPPSPVSVALQTAFPGLVEQEHREAAPRPRAHGPSRGHASGGGNRESGPTHGTEKTPHAALSSSPATPSADPPRHHHHHRHHGGRHTPNRRFYRRVMRCLPWAIASIVLALSLYYGLPAARHAYGRHCLERGLRISASRPDEARDAFLTAKKHRIAGANLALCYGNLSHPGDKAGSEAAVAFEECWGNARPDDIALRQEVIRHIHGLADAGDPAACYLFGRMLDEGKGVGQDSTEAFRLMSVAAGQTQPQAVQWLVDKAKAGDVEAKVVLGRLFLDGKNPADVDADAVRWVLLAGKSDPADAIAWLDAQASAGNAVAQYVVGLQAERKAERTTGDLSTAIEWYRKAAAQGHAEAAQALSRLGVSAD